jgi:hypothetical protein
MDGYGKVVEARRRDGMGTREFIGRGDAVIDGWRRPRVE